MLNTILVIHRYLGVLLGLLMSIWCLSGFVMMYQGFPETTQSERLSALEPIGLSGCCVMPATGLALGVEVADFRIEMLGGRPVLHLSPAGGRPGLFDLATGEVIERIGPAEADRAAALFGKSRGIETSPKLLGEVQTDQWTVATAARNQPVWHYRFGDPAGTEVYVSGVTGQVFQDTTRRERLISWFGAIPHWLYPTVLRQNGPLWSKVVIYSSALGVFLTIAGLYVGVMRFRRLPGGRWSPFRGWWFWHHMIGLLFGVLVVTWTFSGLLTMTPWGLLGGSDRDVRGEVRGKTSITAVERAIAALPRLADGATVQVSAALLGGETHLLAVDESGAARRHNLSGDLEPLQESEVRLALAGQPVQSFILLEEEEPYYYGDVVLPVWRAILADEEKSRVYVDTVSGRILRTVDGDGRAYRWLVEGLHDFDWPVIRRRPVWDFVVLPLLAGVTAVAITGTWLAIQRIGRDAGTLRVMLRRRRRRAAERMQQGRNPA